MTVRDWLTFPKEHDWTTWSGWGLRANAWMNELVDCVGDILTRLGTAETELDDLTASHRDVSGDLTFTGFPTNSSNIEARFIDHENGFATLIVKAIATGAGTAVAIDVTLPEDATADIRDAKGMGVVQFTDVSATPDQDVAGTIKIEADGQSITFWEMPTSAAPANEAVFVGTTIFGGAAIASGDIMSFNLTYFYDG